MIIKKKYKFEAAYANEDGIQGSSFEMYVDFKAFTSNDLLNKVDNFIDNFDHSIMFSEDNENLDFLDNSSERKVIISKVATKNVNPFLYAYLTLHNLTLKERKSIKGIIVDDTKDTSYIMTKKDIEKEKMIDDSFMVKIPQMEIV